MIAAPGGMQVGATVAAAGLGLLAWWATRGYASVSYCARVWAAARR